MPTGASLAIFLDRTSDAISMSPSAPPGTAGGVSETAISIARDGHSRTVVPVIVSPVYASQQCTG